MFDGKKNQVDQDDTATEDIPDTGSLGGESEQEEEEDVTDETMVEDLEEEETDQAE